MKFKNIVFIALCLLFNLMLLSCSDDDNNSSNNNSTNSSANNFSLDIIEDYTPEFNSKDYIKTELNDPEALFVDGINRFTINLFQYASQNNINAKRNTFVSGYSVEQVLAMLSNGACDETLNEILNVFGFKFTLDDFNNYNRVISNLLCSQSDNTKLEIANALWMNDKTKVYRSFISNVDNFYDTDVLPLDFSSEESAKTVNTWCKEKTHGLIESLFHEGPLSGNILITNAIYFDANWLYKFNEKNTHNDTFINSDGSHSDIEMMEHKKSSPMSVINLEKMDMVNIPFSDRFGMVAALPHENEDLLSCIKSMNISDWNYFSYQRQLQSTLTNVKLQMPKFEIDMIGGLVPILEKFGVKMLFSDNSDLSKMSPDVKSIGMLCQTSKLKVFEEGVEATAVTYTSDTSTGTNPQTKDITIRFDRPFIITIYDTKTGIIMFMGCVNNL